MANPFKRAGERVSKKNLGDFGRYGLTPKFASGSSARKLWSTDKAISEGLEANEWVYASVRAIVDAGGSVPIVTYEEDSDGNRVPVGRDEPIQKLLDDPNPNRDGQEFLKTLLGFLMVDGNAIIKKHFAGDGFNPNSRSQPDLKMLELVDPQNIEVKKSSTNFISHYEYNTGSQTLKWDPAEIVHIRMFSLRNKYWGLSPMKAAARSIDSYNEALDYNKATLQNGGVPDGILSIEDDVDDQEWEEFKDNLKNGALDSDNNRRSFLALSAKADWTPIKLSPKEMDWIDSQENLKSAILAVYRTPPPVLGIFREGTFSQENMDAADRFLWKNAVLPLMQSVVAALNKSIAPHFDGSDMGRSAPDRQLTIDIDTSSVDALQGDQAEQVEMFATLVEHGVPANRAIQILDLGWEPLDTGDVPYIKGTLVRADGDRIPNDEM